MSRKRIKVTNESNSGRNQQFHDNYTGDDMTRKQFVDKIRNGDYPNYHLIQIAQRTITWDRRFANK
jgi:hypothetical protein